MYPRCCTFYTIRIVTEFKHVRLKSSNNSLKEKTKLSTEVNKNQSEILCELLDCNVHTAGRIITKSKERKISQHSFYQNAKFCKNYLKLSDIIEFPSLLSLQPSLLKNRYFSLKELGFCNVTPSYIFRFPYILKKTPQDLKAKGYPMTLEYKSNILTDYLNLFQRTEVNNRLKHMYKDGSNCQKIKEVMNAEFLSAKLECSIGNAHQMLYRNSALRVQSILNMDQLLNLLLYKCSLSVAKIYSSVTLLSEHYETVEHFLSEFPEIFDVNTLFLIRKLPLLLKQENEVLQETVAILKDFNISKDQLLCCPRVLSVAPCTLHKRLISLCSTEEFAALRSHKKFLWLAYYYKNLNSRLNTLKAENFPSSINMLTATKNTFEKHLLYNNTRKGIRETYEYLADFLKMSEKDVYTRLQHCSHVEIEDHNCSILNCRKVIEFLVMSGITKMQILNGLEVVYFDVETVKYSFYKMKNHHLCQPYKEWISHYNFIQLLIYIIQSDKYLYGIESDEDGEQCLEVSSNYNL